MCVLLLTWRRALLAQRNEAREALIGLQTKAVSDIEHAAAERQFAATIRAGRALATVPQVGTPLDLSWLDATVALVRDTHGESDVARLASQPHVDARRDRLDELASELAAGPRRSPSSSWMDQALLSAFVLKLPTRVSRGMQGSQERLSRKAIDRPSQASTTSSLKQRAPASALPARTQSRSCGSQNAVAS
jgi:hypothetical protein